MSKEVKPFSYFDSPDGQDVFPKLLLLLKPAALTAFALGTVDVILYSHPKGYLRTLGRYLHFAWPVFAGTAAFVVTQNLSGSIRQKDDKVNWFLGGAAAGSVFGLWRKNPLAAFAVGLGAGVFACVKKDSIQNGYELIPQELKPQYGGLWSVRQDWTLMKHRPGNWTTGRE